ncbi:chalcone-flavanone isomerase-domain-containing protein [Podospora appendiculata]|uniref:Chalcone-flavanone isomerase-domain-containing protein n=1 Tax=Podospora appendiculata TaxID=314037 RepID=A0AAE0X4X5_9PEZI|nr:chalcone-flavanone isomerase-domain-containing protein [Podospora appendiculata]
MLRQPAALGRHLPRARPSGAVLPGHANVNASRRTIFSLRPDKPSGRAVENLNIQRLSRRSNDYQRNKRIFLWSGAVAGVLSFGYTANKLREELAKPVKLDSSLPSTGPLAAAGTASRKVVVHDSEGRELVETGNSTVPTFPRTIDLPAYSAPTAPAPASGPLAPAVSSASTTTEYTLVGFGTRTVTFVGIQVYVVGYYIATADIAALQNSLTKKVNPIATTLVPGEREQLRTALLDPAEGEQMWDDLLARGIPARSAFRIVPVRDTDFHHLRDGFVRSIQARGPTGEHADDSFGEAMREFRNIFNRGKVPKSKELLLVRDGAGKLSIAFDDGGSKKEDHPAGRRLIGVVEDERVSRALWLNWLAGKKVASEPARKSIVEGLMEFVERPVGTVATQVV